MQNYPTVDPEGENVETNNNILNLLLILLANHNFKLSTRILLRKMFTTQYESIQYINIVLDYWYGTEQCTYTVKRSIESVNACFCLYTREQRP